MPVEMILNELSIYPLASDVWEARQRMDGLIATILEAVNRRVSRVIRTKEEFYLTPLSEELALVDWLVDRHVNIDRRRYIRSLISKAPFLVDLPEIENQFLIREFRFEGQLAWGLGSAFLMGGLAISFLSAVSWDTFRLTIEIDSYEEDGQIRNDHVEIAHASRSDHILNNIDWINKRITIDVRDGLDLWQRREAIFPSLLFTEAVYQQISDWGPNHPMLGPVAERLIKIDDYCREWTEGGFNNDALGFSVSVESQTTLQRFSSERTFRCMDGVERVFSWHAKLAGGIRIYFYPDPESRTIHIGYIGHHLPTVRHR
jgi:hypothetical protein